MDNTAAIILLYRQVTGSAPSNAPLTEIHLLRGKTCPTLKKSSDFYQKQNLNHAYVHVDHSNVLSFSLHPVWMENTLKDGTH